MSGESSDGGNSALRDSEGTRSRPQGETTATESRDVQHLQEDLSTFDLGAEAAKLAAEARTSSTGRSSKTLVKLPHLHLTLTAVKGGTRIEEHQNRAPVSILGLAGTFRLETVKRNLELGPQKVATLAPLIRHSVVAHDDCVFLLTVGWGTEAAEAAEASHQRAQPSPV
jgi:quercetin dioxygenase-like cupin family protein